MSRAREAGFTLVEMMIAGALGIALLTAVSVATSATSHSAHDAIQQGTTTGSALLAVQAVQDSLAGASTYNPTLAAGLTSGTSSGTSLAVTPLALAVASGQSVVVGSGASSQTFTTTAPSAVGATTISVVSQSANATYGVGTIVHIGQCAGGSNGQAFTDGNGPFVSATASDIVFCGLRNNSSTAYSYHLHFADCSGSGICNLQIDRYAPPGCSPCHTTTVFTMANVSDAGTPFVYDYYDRGSAAWEPTAVLSQVQAVQVTYTVAASGVSGTTVKRLVLLPNTLGGTS